MAQFWTDDILVTTTTTITNRGGGRGSDAATAIFFTSRHFTLPSLFLSLSMQAFTTRHVHIVF